MSSDSVSGVEIRAVPEPQLEFGFAQKLQYPRDGLYLYGPPSSAASISEVRYGVIGTEEGVRRFRNWCDQAAKFIDIPELSMRSKEIEPHHIPFPGFEQAFNAHWPAQPIEIISDIDRTLLEQALKIRNRHEAVKSAVSMYVDRLVAAQDRLENPPSFWFVVIPEEVYALGRPQSRISKADRIEGEVRISASRARYLDGRPTLFGEEEKEAEVYKYAAHFRRQLKARLLKDRIVTQIVRETTVAPGDFQSEGGGGRSGDWRTRRRWRGSCVPVPTTRRAGDHGSWLMFVPGSVMLAWSTRGAIRWVMIATPGCAAQMFLSDGDGRPCSGAHSGRGTRRTLGSIT